MLTPLDIHNKEFRRSFRGYDEREVDEFLDRVIKDYEQLYRDNIELKENMERLGSKLEHYQHMEGTLHNTLLVAQETAEEINAQKLSDEAAHRVRKLETEQEELQKQIHVYRTRMRTLIQAQLELLKDAEDEDQ